MPTDSPTARTARAALRLTAASTAVIAAAYVCAFAGAPGARLGAWLMALGNAGLVASMMALGARRLAPLFCGTFVVLFASLAAALVLPPNEAPGVHLVLGLPLRAAVVVYGIGILPLLVLPLAFALTFDKSAR